MTFQFFSVPVTVRTSFWLLSLALGLSRLSQPILVVEWVAVMGLAIFVHELGHAVAFLAFGHKPAIELHGMGGLTRSLGGGPRLSPGRDAVISFAGPAFGYLLALVVWAVTRVVEVPDAPALGGVLVSDLLWASAGWSTLNLCPILPLDGGQLMYAGMRARFGDRAPMLAHAVSLVVALAAMGASRWAGWTWTLYMAVWFAATNVQALIGLRDAKARRSAAHAGAGGPSAAPLSGAGAPSTDPLFVKAQRLACETWLKKGDFNRAWELAQALPPAAVDAPLLAAFADTLFAARQYTLAEGLCARRFQAWGDPGGAFDAACAAALDGRADAAFAWLRQAIDAGLTGRAAYESNASLALLRTDPRWTGLMARLPASARS